MQDLSEWVQLVGPDSPKAFFAKRPDAWADAQEFYSRREELGVTVKSYINRRLRTEFGLPSSITTEAVATYMRRHAQAAD